MQRITDSVLRTKLDSVNELYRERFDATRDMVALYCASGSFHRTWWTLSTIGKGSARRAGFGTKRETAMFLDGMRHALFLVPPVPLGGRGSTTVQKLNIPDDNR